MAEIKVNPTRMELKKLKGRLVTARRGHKLLKDKRDELMRQFLDIVREAAELRRKLNGEFAAVDESFAAAAAESDPRMLTEALLLPGTEGELTVGTRNIMSVITPVFDYKTTGAVDRGGVSYGLAFTSGSLDGAVREVSAAAEELVHLAQLEKSAMLLCDEIERTRRRVNALEYIMIPQYERGVKTISMKLDENERGSQTRLMKVKDMMLKASMEGKSRYDEDDDDETDEA